jgi:ferredoxin--NADP+ reductase
LGTVETPTFRARSDETFAPTLVSIGSGGAAARSALLSHVAAPAPERRREFVANASLVEREDLTPSVARFIVAADVPIPQFEPGQYFSLGLPTGGGMLLRPYSTASPRGARDALEFLVRRVPGGAFTPTLWNAAVGDRLWIGPPKGLFRLTPNDPRTHLFVSSGTGIAPFISMLDELLQRREIGDDGAQPEAQSGPQVVVAHGVSYAAELAYRDRLERDASANPRLAYVPTISRPAAPENAGWVGRTGRVESILADLCAQLLLDPASTVAYLCGNPEMIAASRETLRRLGFPAGAVVHENYWAAPGA